MSAPGRPAPPIVGKVTHHSVELYWDEALEKENKKYKKGDGRMRVVVQEQDQSGTWGNVYTGYAKRHKLTGLEPWTQYTYRICFKNDYGNSEYSPSVPVSTTKEPVTGEHLHRAIVVQNLDLLEEILDKGEANVDSPDKYGFTPLMQASQKNMIEFMECLLKHGADVNFQNEAGKSALMLAAFAGKTDACKELVHHGAKYDLRDRGGSSAMHWAMDSGQLELIQFMIDDGANMEAKDKNGWTPLLRVASVGGNRDVANLLIRNKVHVNDRDKDGKSALMIAVINGHQGLVELLLDKGADLGVKNEYGKNSYEMAISMERRRIAKTFEEHMDRNGIKYHH